MKIKSLEIENIGKIIKEKIVFDKPLILFFGEVMQGKTTILNSVKYALGGKFPNDVLRHGTDRGFIRIEFDNSSIKRAFRRAKDGTIKAGKIEFIREGSLESKPADAIKQFLNPFLLDQDFFTRKSELERNRYFVELFDVDTTNIDKEIEEIKKSNEILRAKIDTYGEIDITPVEKVDTYALIQERNKKLDVYQDDKLKRIQVNTSINNKNMALSVALDNIKEFSKNIKDFESKISDLKEKKLELETKITGEKRLELLPDIPLPDTKEIDEKISDAKAQNVQYERYTENKERYGEKQKKNIALSEQECQLKNLRADKIKQLAGISDKCGVPGLVFDESANAIYEGTTLGMLSMSQIMRLSSALKSLYPKGFGLELLDRGESLGKSIYNFIEKAKKEESTILATIVGEKPAKIPEDVGVFVVEKGKLTKK